MSWGERIPAASLRHRMRKDCHAEQRAGGNIEDGDAGGAPSAGGNSAPSGGSQEGGTEQPGKEGTHHWSPREGTRSTGGCSGLRVAERGQGAP